VTTLYNQKVGPLAGFNVAGTLWYQGESNSGRPELYTEELAVLKKGWERTFNFEKGTMPFVFCQVGRWEG
jgi:sialate O-acetylesterase